MLWRLVVLPLVSNLESGDKVGLMVLPGSMNESEQASVAGSKR